MAGIDHEEVVGELMCPICLDLFTHPIILPCSHILCRRPCAENLFGGSFIRCPVCRDNCYVSGGLASLPRVIALENIIEKFNAASRRVRDSESPESGPDNVTAGLGAVGEVLCQLCEAPPKRARKSCLDCNASYCKRCLRISHPNREPFNLHELVDPRPDLRPREAKCAEHSEKLTTYCFQCKTPACILCDEKNLHEGHRTVSLEDAYVNLKGVLGESVDLLKTSQSKLTKALATRRGATAELEAVINRRKELVNAECDSLTAAVESKRTFFLGDLDYEERVRKADSDNTIKGLERMLASSQSLAQYTHDVMAKKNAASFLLLANALNDRLVKVTLDCECFPVEPESEEIFEGKVVDCRKERAFLQDIHYLLAPATPIIDVTRCSRSEDTVALILCPPKSHHDVVDTYEVNFCSEEQKRLDLEDTSIFGNPQEDRQIVKGVGSGGYLVLLIDNLCRGTTYYFCITACNVTGKSTSSEVVQCATLLQREGTVPAPAILDSLCRQFTSSIQVCSSSPLDVAADQKISHYLLFRDSMSNLAYKSVPMFDRQEHRVFGLYPNNDYDFMIMACNPKGECRLSSKLTLRTEQSALHVEQQPETSE